jgi:ABC-type cobalamin transport system permease subunit
MIAVINNVVAGAGVALLTRLLIPSAPRWVDAAAGVVGALVLTWLFYAYQRWRFSEFIVRSREPIGS